MQGNTELRPIGGVIEVTKPEIVVAAHDRRELCRLNGRPIAAPDGAMPGARFNVGGGFGMTGGLFKVTDDGLLERVTGVSRHQRRGMARRSKRRGN